jgi:cobalt-zinc-cadmium efflux system outer membrane protein
MKRKTFSKYLLCIGLATAATLPSHAAGSGELSLDRAIRLALANNPELQASDARKEAAAGRQEQARAWPNPELELSSEDMPVNRSRMSQGKHMAGISQTLPWPGKRKADGEVGAADAAAGAADWRLDRADLVREVKLAYYQVKAAERAAAVAEDLVKVAEAVAGDAGKRNAAGEITLREQLRAEIQLEHARTEKIEAVREGDTARQSLVLLLGRQDLRDAKLTDALAETINPSLTRLTSSAWLVSHPAMVAARARRDQAAATARRAGLEPMPDVKVGVAGGRDEAAEENLMEFRLSLPLPLFDRNKGKQQEAMAGVKEAEAGVTATEQRLIAEWRAAVTRYKAAADQVAACRDRILPKSEEALQLVQTGFDEGKFGFIDLLDTQRTTAEARMIYQKKLFELNAAQAELEAMTEPVPAL